MFIFKGLTGLLFLFGVLINSTWAGSPHNCICPFCETLVANPGTQSCGQMKCPADGTIMRRALYLGAPMANTQNTPPAEAPNSLSPVAVGMFLHNGRNGSPPPPPTAPQNTINTDQITYTNTISGIIEVSCLRCHSGPFRNLSNYENVKAYADNGLLKTLVEPGGLMNRFSGKNTPDFLEWIKNGAPK